jgi:hypothetical protein
MFFDFPVVVLASLQPPIDTEFSGGVVEILRRHVRFAVFSVLAAPARYTEYRNVLESQCIFAVPENLAEFGVRTGVGILNDFSHKVVVEYGVFADQPFLCGVSRKPDVQHRYIQCNRVYQ